MLGHDETAGESWPGPQRGMRSSKLSQRNNFDHGSSSQTIRGVDRRGNLKSRCQCPSEHKIAILVEEREFLHKSIPITCSAVIYLTRRLRPIKLSRSEDGSRFVTRDSQTRTTDFSFEFLAVPADNPFQISSG